MHASTTTATNRHHYRGPYPYYRRHDSHHRRHRFFPYYCRYHCRRRRLWNRYYTDIPDTDPPRNGTSAAAAKAAGIDLPKTPPNDGWAQDIGAIQTKLDLEGNPNGFATESPWLTAVPGGFRVLLKYVAERYGNPVIMVTENGMDREGEAGMAVEEALRDRARQEFYDGYLRSMVAAVSGGWVGWGNNGMYSSGEAGMGVEEALRDWARHNFMIDTKIDGGRGEWEVGDDEGGAGGGGLAVEGGGRGERG